MKIVVFLFAFVNIIITYSSAESLNRACGQNVNFCDIGPWMSWGLCDQNCGGGIQTRRKPICCDVSRVKSLDECLKACRKDKNEFNKITTDRKTCRTVCYNGGTFDLARHTCDCVNGTWGRCCETQVDDCKSNPCKHGYCYDRLFAYFCSCYPGYSGRNCEKSICDNYKCENKGTCYIDREIRQNRYFFIPKCRCLMGYQGDKCQNASTSTTSTTITYRILTTKSSSTTTVHLETKASTTKTTTPKTTPTTPKTTPTNTYQPTIPSTNKPTSSTSRTTTQRLVTKVSHVHLTTLSNPVSLSTLKHKIQHSFMSPASVNIQIGVHACASSPCFHGTCIPYGNQHMCYCSPGYTGQNCQFEKDECESEPCSYGDCFDKVNDYHCECNMFFHGKRCTKMKLWGILSISFGCLTLLALCSCCVFCIPSRKRNDDDEEEDNRNQVVPNKKRPMPPTKKPMKAWS